MSNSPARRNVLAATAAATGLLALGPAARADERATGAWSGEWLNEGRDAEPCAIFVHGRVLLLVNEHLHLAIGRITAARKIVVRDALPWTDPKVADELVGVLSPNGKTITWANKARWTRV